MSSTTPMDVQPLLDRLVLLPFDVADNVTIVEHHIHVTQVASGQNTIYGSLIVNVFGRRIELRVLPQNAASDPFVFHGEMVEPLVDYGESGRFTLTTLQIKLQPPATNEKDAWSFEVSGRGRLELRGRIAGETGSFVADGHLRAVRLAGTTEHYLRMDFNDAALRLGIAGGVTLVMSPKRLFFLVDDRGEVDLELRVSCKMIALPSWLENALDGPIDADVIVNSGGLVITTGTIREHSKLDLSSLGIADRGLLASVDEIDFSVKHLRIEVGSRIECRLDVDVKVPAPFLSFAEPQFSFRITATANDLAIRLLSSPLVSLKLKPSTDGSLAANLKLGAFGEMSFIMPQWHLDWASGCLVAEGQLSFRDLRLPLGPIISLLKSRGYHAFAEHLPESLPLQSFGLTGIAAALTDFIALSLGTTTFAQQAVEELNRLLQRLDRLPLRLRESFLHIDVPQELVFRVEFTTDLGARIRFSPPPSPLTGETTPLHLLVPLHGPSGPELYGVTLYHFSLGQIRAGSLFTVEIDAEVDRFELLPIALAMTMSKESCFASPDGVEQRFICRDLFSILTFPSGTPVLVPLFFRHLGFVHSGLDGLAAGAHFRLPAPTIDFAGLARFVTGFHGPAQIQNDVRLTLTIGPAYVQLPHYLGGNVIGSRENQVTLEASADISRVVSAVQSLHIDTLLASIPADFGAREVELNLGRGYRKASRLWATVAEPALFLSANAMTGTPPPEKSKGLAGKWKAMTGHLADGLSALASDTSEALLHARFVAVQSTGIRFYITSPDALEPPVDENIIELKWDNFLGSAAGLAARSRPGL